MFALRDTHPGLFGVTLIETWTHFVLGVAYIVLGRFNQSLPTSRHVYRVFDQTGPLWAWGAAHVLIAFVILYGVAYNRWFVVRKAMIASVLSYAVMTSMFLVGMLGAGLSPLGTLTYVTVLVCFSSLGSLSFYAAIEPPVNPANER